MQASVLGCVLLFVALAAASGELQMTMSVVPNTPRIILGFNVTNPSAAQVSILTYGTPMEEDLYGPIFEVTDLEGNAVQYIGKMARRRFPPPPSAYLNLGPLQTLSTQLDLTDAYAFPSAGEYRIRFVGMPHHADDQQSNVRLSSTEDEVVGRLPIVNRRKWAPDPLGNTNCKATEESQVRTAVAGATTESLTAYACMSKRTCTALSTRWFGAYNQANYDYDTGVFNQVSNRLKNYAFNAYCNPTGCSNNVFAYVYPTDPAYTVYLCGAFWSEPTERVNTIVHEMSHFSTLGDTQDYTYGKPNCLSLATSNAQRASHNADNICYFSEEAR